ncbi:MAG: SDR family oxidoreductase [Anaerolineae bacterium]
MQSILITGSNRGIGLALVEAYLAQADVHVFATCRDPQSAEALQTLAQDHPLTVIALDINDPQSIAQAVEQVSAQTDHLDVLINNAGIYPRSPAHETVGELTHDALSHVITTNAVSPVIVTQAFEPLLQAADAPRVAMISSQMGSITRARAHGLSYRMSKAAMNMGATVLAEHWTGADILVVILHPGHVATDMGGNSAPVTPADSAQGMIQIITALTAEQSGQFYDYTGADMPW